MINYKVSQDEANRCFRIKGNILPGSKAVKMPTDTMKRQKMQHQFISFFLNKADIESGIDYLNCISLNNHFRANEGLFVGALSSYFKCFQSNGARVALDEGAFKRFSPPLSDEFDRFKSWRNKHYIHDENSMIQACCFLIIAPVGHHEKFGGPPSVVWNSAPVDYIREGQLLKNLMQETWRFVINKIDEIGDNILKEFGSTSHNELLALEDAHIELATVDRPDQKRG